MPDRRVPADPAGRPASVDLWVIPLTGATPAADVLSPTERERAARFRFDRDRARYVAAHGAMRCILGDALGRPPASLAFEVGPLGKPALADHPALHFNLSHSRDLAVLAVTTHGPVGVDVEAALPIPDSVAVAEANFSPAERAALRRLPEAERVAGFHRLWTRKEAYLKAIGTGLSHALDRFTVTSDAAAARVVEIDGDAAAGARWAVAPLVLPSPFVGAVAIRAEGIVLRPRTWPA
jgi:4'-phosphopantetheinyl transferase